MHVDSGDAGLLGAVVGVIELTVGGPVCGEICTAIPFVIVIPAERLALPEIVTDAGVAAPAFELAAVAFRAECRSDAPIAEGWGMNRRRTLGNDRSDNTAVLIEACN